MRCFYFDVRTLPLQAFELLAYELAGEPVPTYRTTGKFGSRLLDIIEVRKVKA